MNSVHYEGENSYFERTSLSRGYKRCGQLRGLVRGTDYVRTT